MLHHIAGDLNSPQNLYLPSILKSFSKIWEQVIITIFILIIIIIIIIIAIVTIIISIVTIINILTMMRQVVV